jgi:hypothetical protein
MIWELLSTVHSPCHYCEGLSENADFIAIILVEHGHLGARLQPSHNQTKQSDIKLFSIRH